jgi:hypothetical protein
MSAPPAPSDDFRSDDELTRAHRRGDASAFPELVRRHEPRLRAYVFGDPTWAAAGDTLLKHIWASAERGVREGRFRGGSFRAWLFKAADGVAGQLPNGTPTTRAVRLGRCFTLLAQSKPHWHRAVMWVSHGVNRTVTARRLKVSKARLRERYAKAVAVVRECAARRAEVTSDEPSSGAAT